MRPKTNSPSTNTQLDDMVDCGRVRAERDRRRRRASEEVAAQGHLGAEQTQKRRCETGAGAARRTCRVRCLLRLAARREPSSPSLIPRESTQKGSRLIAAALFSPKSRARHAFLSARPSAVDRVSSSFFFFLSLSRSRFRRVTNSTSPRGSIVVTRCCGKEKPGRGRIDNNAIRPSDCYGN
jgi:hypothetical protein